MYNTKAEIMTRLKEHYAAAAQLVPENKIVGIFLQGSQNYNLSTAKSDIDTRCVIVPSFKEIINSSQPKSITHVMPNGEFIDIKDIRLVINTFRKQNINALEILFTDYYIINPKYSKLWTMLVQDREAIARYSPYAVAKTIKGMAKERYNAFLKGCSIEEETYPVKQLCHLNRFYYFFYDYFYGNKTYAEILKCDGNRKKYLMAIKNGNLTACAAKETATAIFNAITLLTDAWCREHANERYNTDPYVDKLCYLVLSEIIKKSFKEDITRGE